MVLAADVSDLSGRVLLKAGCVIQPGHLQILATWGVTAVGVTGEGLGGSNPDPEREECRIPAAALREIEAEVVRRFSVVNGDHPLMRRLAAIVKQDLMSNYSLHGDE